MDNEEIMQEELPAEIPESSENGQDQAEQLEELRSEVAELKIKLALLSGGAAPEKLAEGVKRAEGILSAEGAQPEDAAAKVLEEYPHIRLAKRSVPKLSAESGGKGDGFAAIRSIFARK